MTNRSRTQLMLSSYWNMTLSRRYLDWPSNYLDKVGCSKIGIFFITDVIITVHMYNGSYSNFGGIPRHYKLQHEFRVTFDHWGRNDEWTCVSDNL